MVSNAVVSQNKESTQKTVPLQVLLAYDGSKHAQAAVELISDLPLASDSKIITLAVIPTQHLAGHETLSDRLDQVRLRLEAKGVEVESIFRAGHPAATINEQSLWNEVNLTVVGAKGLRATFGILLGGVAQQVVEYSCCPVLVVREPYQGLRRVLLLIDGSSYSQSAIEYLAPPKESNRPRFPLPLDARLTVLHVLPPPITPETITRSWTVGPEVLYPIPPLEVDMENFEKREEDEGQLLLNRSLSKLAFSGIQGDSKLLRGDAATEIIQYVKDHEIDLIIAGSRGLSQVTGWLLGSVSRKLVHYANCSVLIVKQPPE